MSTSLLIGKAKELHVATLLVAKHLHVYFPFVDNGFDLLVSSADGTKILPVQVKYKQTRTGFSLKRGDVEKFEACNAVLAFGSGTADASSFYFFPAKEWASRAENRQRADEMVVVSLKENAAWIEQFLGESGINLAFKAVLPRD